jgi:hypothetical protein
VITEHEWRERQRANVLAALRQASGRISGKGGAADLLGINPATLCIAEAIPWFCYFSSCRLHHCRQRSE